MTKPLYKRSKEAIFAEVADDIVALHVERGQSYGMEKVTAAVWRLLADPTDVESICAELTSLYEVEPDTCQAEVARLIAQFEKEGLVEKVASA
ncbi:MAG: PqqD family protein [Sphingomicrobium sp.]